MTSDQLTPEEQKVLAYVKSGSAFQLLQLLAEEDPETKKIIEGDSFTLGMRVAGGMRRSVRIAGGRIEPIDGTIGGAGLIFRFPRYNELNKLLSGRKAKMLPIIRSFSAGKIISSFKQLTSRIPAYMNAEDEFLRQNFNAVTRMLMFAALRGIKEVAENDSYTSARVAGIPDGIISIRVENEKNLEAFIEKQGGSFTVRKDCGDAKPNAVLIFKNAETAFNLFKGKINAVAALGTSDVRIRGRIPMIQGLFPILDRLSYYMAIK